MPELSHSLTVPNILYFLVSALFLLLSFTDPKSKWSVNVEFFGCSETFDVYGGLFIFCMVLYIPMMVFAFCYLVRAIVAFVKTKNFQGGISFLATSIVGVIAIYCFDHWVFSEIF
ncbi:hypothetical protein J3D54_001755 [Pseudomonas sp. GGS8]|uniref:hypothetical protein n=1 Tax=Pseudomonas sp. GGS8 TaxID=2817892 RepID=UPI00209F22E2|nr:hypothetical protein [Pseudomonas sp. GGS8]MCP1442623.1 hypothetical protein [Pseudomonas sp. GGS8]